MFKRTASTADLRSVNWSPVVFRTSAGRSAETRYRQLSVAWRNRVLKRVRVPLLGTAAVLFAVAAAGGLLDLSWWLGFGFGTLVTIYAALHESVPDHIDQWRHGAEAERRTAKELRKLRRRGWHVVHDLADGRGNRDHVVVGPGGLFLIDTKSPRGRVKIDGRGVMRVDRVDNPHASYRQVDLAGRVRHGAIRLKRDIEQSTGQQNLWVNAVVVVWSRFDQGVVEGDRITFVHGDDLASWLEARPAVQQQPKTEAIAAALSVAARAAT